MTDEQKVKNFYPGAEIVGHPHGKVQAWSLTSGFLGDMAYKGTREQCRAQAWKTAADRPAMESE